MPSLTLIRLFGRELGSSDAASVSGFLAAQWKSPKDILSILLLLGPNVVQSAVAQLSGRAVTPIAFSFGWVAYAVNAILSSVGDGHLMPDAEAAVTVVDIGSGHGRVSNNWILGRLIRDFEEVVNQDMRYEQPHVPSHIPLDEEEPTRNAVKGQPLRTLRQPFQKHRRPKAWEALRVTVFEVDDSQPLPHGVPKLDWIWYLGFVIIFIQLGISTIPWAVDGQWGTFLITLSGTALALIGGSLAQWTREKWACPKTGGATAAITRGNGSRNAMVILGKRDSGLKFEVLAQGTRTSTASLFTKMAIFALASLWVALLITVQGLSQNSWYLLGISMLGSIQNVVAAGAGRDPSALGIHIKEVDLIRGRFVADVLKQVETRYPLVGTALLDTFFPGSLRVKDPEDIAFWRAALDARKRSNKHGTRLDCLPPLDEA